MKISLLHPSRGRPEKAFEAFQEWTSKASGENAIEYILSIDTTDPKREEYRELHEYSEAWDDGTYYVRTMPVSLSHPSRTPFKKLLVNPNRSLVDAANNAAKVCSGDILVLMSDDFGCPQFWDEAIIAAFGKLVNHDFCLKTFDGTQPWIITLPIMTRKYYERFGYIYNPEYLHMFCDTEQATVAHYLAKMIIRLDLLFPHRHYTTGETARDSVNEKADSTWQQGERVYLERFQRDFDLPNDEILQWLGNSGSMHQYEWCKKQGLVKPQLGIRSW